MKLLTITRPVLIALIAIAMPGIACFGYYTLENYGDVGAGMAMLLVLAWPVALIGLLWLVTAVLAAMHTARRRPSHLSLAAVCLVVPVVFLLWARA